MNWKGPSVQIDTACASSFNAFVQAFHSIKNNLCDQAVVAGAQINLRPSVSCGFKHLSMLAKDGRCKCLDAKADGYCRSEGVVSLVLQKKANCKRIYAQIINSLTNCDGYKEEGITFPNYIRQSNLIKETLLRAKVNPLDIEYVEAHLTGTQAGDPAECKAILQSIRPENEKPLLFGAVKSSMGHCEAPSALCAVSKVLKIFQNREIPPNINYETPNPLIEGLKTGIIIPVLKRTKFNHNLISINSFGFGGVNVHAILAANKKNLSKESYLIADELPRLVQVCNRTEKGIQVMLKRFKDRAKPLTRDYLALINDISKMDPSLGFNFRGYSVLNQENTLTSKWNKINFQQPICVMLTPFDENLIHLCKPLFKFKVFDETIKQLAHHVEPVGYNLVKEIQKGHPKSLENFYPNTVIATVAIQIGLISLLRHLDIEVENFIGFSFGEVAAAYANQTIDEKQAILTAYWLGLFQEKQLPDQSFLVEKLKTILTNGKVNQKPFELDNFVNRITSSTDPQETLKPSKDTVVLMIGNVQSFVDKSLRASFIHLVSQSQRQEDMTENVLIGIGELYCNGHNPSIEKLYPKVEYPVARETETLGHLIKWSHSTSYFFPKYPKYFKCKVECIYTFQIDINNPEFRFLSGHCIDGRILFPAVGYLILISQMVATFLGYLDFSKISIDFYKFKLRKALLLTSSTPTAAVCQVWKESQKFQISSDNEICAEGYYKLDYSVIDYKSLMVSYPAPDAMKLQKKDFYKLLRIRGYDYRDVFQGVEEAMSDGSSATVKFSKNWVAFADSCFQVAILDKKSGLYLPTTIDYVKCDYPVLKRTIDEASAHGNESKLTVYFNKMANLGVAHGLIIKGLKAASIPRRSNTQRASLEKFEFTEYNQDIILSPRSLERLENYQNACRQCFEVFKGDENKELDNKLIRKYVDSKSSRYSLLSTLNEVLSKQKDENGKIVKTKDELLQDLMEILKKNQIELSKDYTFETPLLACAVHQLQVVVDNVSTKVIKIIEVNLSKDPMFYILQHYLECRGLKSDITLMIPEAELGEYAEKYTSEKIVKIPTLQKTNTQLDCSDFIIFKDPRATFYANQESINAFTFEHILQTCFDHLKQTGFVLLILQLQRSEIEKELAELINVQRCQFFDFANLQKVISNIGFEMVSQSKTDDKNWVTILLKKPCDVESIKESMKIIKIEAETFDWIDELKKSIPNENLQRIWLTTSGSPINGLIGLQQCLKKEPKGGKLRILFNMANEDDPKNQLAVTDELIRKDIVMNVFNDNKQHGCILSQYLDVDEVTTTSKNVYLDIVTKGDLSSLRWFKSQFDDTKIADFLVEKNVKLSLVKIYYSALNFRDVMLASGRVSIDGYSHLCQRNPNCLGIEYSGVDETGQRIMGISQGQAIANIILIDDRFLRWKVPDNMTLEEAATIPVCYYTVYYSLIIRGKLKPGEKVLIHAGSGGVGQAAISVCLNRHCEVFTTVSTQAKRDFLKEKFPQLTDDHISNSRTTEFEEQVLKMTNGMGVDLVLNSLADDKLQASIRCLAEYGRFLEIGKYDVIMDSKLGKKRNLIMMKSL